MTSPFRAILLAVALILPNIAYATTLYSIDATTDRLVSIDTNTLAISDIGALGVDVTSTDGLAFTDSNTLYSTFSIGGVNHLYRVDAVTGNASLVKANYVARSEAMTSRVSDGALFISYDASHPAGSSDQLGRVNTTDGSVTHLGSIGRDTDTLAFRADGTLFGSDVTVSNTPAQSLFSSIDPTNAAATVLGGAFATDYNLNGMSFGNDGVLYGIMNDVLGSGSYLAVINIGVGTPTITPLGLLSGNRLTDLTAQSESSVPEPATFVLLGLGFLGIGSRRRRIRS